VAEVSLLETTGIKGIGAMIISFIISKIDVVNEAIVVLVFFMLLDLITGLLRSWVTKYMDSTIGLAGVVKKVAIFVKVGMAAAVEYMVMAAGQDSRGLL